MKKPTPKNSKADIKGMDMVKGQQRNNMPRKQSGIMMAAKSNKPKYDPC
ncbi:MAG TPA: hypothetical protein VIM65_20605 [Cyclobacteriaceae bacterium]